MIAGYVIRRKIKQMARRRGTPSYILGSGELFSEISKENKYDPTHVYEWDGEKVKDLGVKQ